MVPLVFMFFDFSQRCSQSSSENDLLISSLFESCSFYCMVTCEGKPLSLSDQLNRKLSNEWIPIGGGKPPRDPGLQHSETLLLVISTCYFAILKHFGSMAGFKLQTSAFTATRSTIWDTMLWSLEILIWKLYKLTLGCFYRIDSLGQS